MLRIADCICDGVRFAVPSRPKSIRFSPIQESTTCLTKWANAWRRVERIISNTMALSPFVTLIDREKLDLLRRLDQFRLWHSLDDKRYCPVCGKIITGQQIQVAGGTRGNGALRLSCPSERCNSIPMDWVLPTDEILARVELVAPGEHEAATSTRISHGRIPNRRHETHHGIAPQLRNFASRL
jgi:hypothetical protein